MNGGGGGGGGGEGKDAGGVDGGGGGGGGGSGALALALVPDSEPIDAFLEEHGLAEYAETLDAEGFDDTDSLFTIRRSDLEAMNIGADGIDKILAAVAPHRPADLSSDEEDGGGGPGDKKGGAFSDDSGDEGGGGYDGRSDEGGSRGGGSDSDGEGHGPDDDGPLVGVTIERMFPGDGKSYPQEGHFCRVHLSGSIGGKVFESSRKRERPFEFQLGAESEHVIPGFDRAVARMTNGERCRVTIDPEMAYGEEGRVPVIPPDTKIVFEVELIGSYDAPVGDDVFYDDDEEGED